MSSPDYLSSEKVPTAAGFRSTQHVRVRAQHGVPLAPSHVHGAAPSPRPNANRPGILSAVLVRRLTLAQAVGLGSYWEQPAVSDRTQLNNRTQQTTGGSRHPDDKPVEEWLSTA
jgi:hypothetical protein